MGKWIFFISFHISLLQVALCFTASEAPIFLEQNITGHFGIVFQRNRGHAQNIRKMLHLLGDNQLNNIKTNTYNACNERFMPFEFEHLWFLSCVSSMNISSEISMQTKIYNFENWTLAGISWLSGKIVDEFLLAITEFRRGMKIHMSITFFTLQDPVHIIHSSKKDYHMESALILPHLGMYCTRRYKVQTEVSSRGTSLTWSSRGISLTWSNRGVSLMWSERGASYLWSKPYMHFCPLTRCRKLFCISWYECAISAKHRSFAAQNCGFLPYYIDVNKRGTCLTWCKCLPPAWEKNEVTWN